MSGIQYQSLSDDEFERAVYMAIGVAGTLPAEVAKELAQRKINGERDKERSRDAHNPLQQSLPFPK